MSMYDERIAKLKKQQNENSQSLKTSQAGSMYDERIAAIKASENPSAKANADIISLFSEKYREDQQKRTENAKRFQEERQEFKSRHGSNVDLMKFDLDAGQKEIDKLVAELARLRTEKNAKALDFSSRPYAAGQVAEDAQYTTGYGITNNRPYAAGLQAQQNIEVKDDPIRELEMQIAKKKQDFNLAKQYQKEVAYDDTVKNADFDQYDDYAESDDTLYNWINDSRFRERYEASYQSIPNPNARRSKYTRKGYDQMNASEIAIYNYYYAKSGKEAAQKYLDTIQERLNERTAKNMYSTVKDDTAAEIVFGAAVGINQFITNVANNFRFKDDYIPQSAYQIAGKMADEGLADASIPLWYNFKEGKWEDKILGRSLGQIAYDAVTTGANMAPSILASYAVAAAAGTLGLSAKAAQTVGSYAGNTAMGLSAAGGAYQQALNEGYDKNQARGYSILVGASEMAMEKLLGGISAVGGNALGRNAVKNIANADTALKAIAKRVGGSALSEFGEEYLQEVLDPVFSNIMLKTDKEVKPISAEALYSGILGMLTGAIMEAPFAIYGEAQTASTGRKLKEAGGVDSLAKIGNTFAADTVAYKLAGKVNENTGAYTIGQLLKEVDATLTEQNVNEIAEALMKEGVGEIAAKKYAQAFAYVVEGGAMPDSMVNAIEADTVLAKAAIEVLIDSNTTWNQRTQGYNEVLRKLAMDKVTGKKSGKVTPATDQKSLQVDKNSLTTAEESAAVENENATSGAQTVEGRDIHTGTQEAVSTDKIKSITKDGVVFAQEDGSEVSSKDVAYADAEDGLIFEAFTEMRELGTDAANEIIGIRRKVGGSGQLFANVMRIAYEYGYANLSESGLLAKTYHGNIPTNAVQRIYQIGKEARAAEDARRAQAKKSIVGGKTEVYRLTETGEVKKLGEGKEALKVLAVNERKSVGVKTAQFLQKIGVGGNYYFIQSYTDKDGNRLFLDRNGNVQDAHNGMYYSNGDIYIDLNAEVGSSGITLFTISHELAHFVQQWNAEKYKVLADFLAKHYAKNGASAYRAIKIKQQTLSEARGTKVSFEEAYHEFVADSLSTMFSDGNIYEKLLDLKKTDKFVFDKIRSYINKLAQKAKAYYSGEIAPTMEGQFMQMQSKETIDQLQQLFADALVGASENYRGELNVGKGQSAQADMDAEADVQFSDNPYSYKAITSKPDMVVTYVDSYVPKDRNDIISIAKQNAANVGTTNPKTGSVSVYVKDIGRDIGIGRDGLKHSFDRRIAVNAPVILKAGEIISNSIRINELTPKKDNIEESYVLIGAARNANDDLYIVRSVINRFTHNLVSMDVLYAINAKKEPAALLPLSAEKTALGTDSKISIAKLLDYVNQYFPDILPEDILKHYGYDSRPAGELGERALYSDASSEPVSNRSLLANAMESLAETELEKKKLTEYKAKIDQINAEEQKLSEVRAQIKELSFAKGSRDKEKLRALRDEAIKLSHHIDIYDKQLLRLEASKPLQNVLDREKAKAYQRGKEKGEAALKEYKQKAMTEQEQMKKRYEESRKRSVENRNKTAMRHKIRKTIRELDKLLNRGSKERNVKEGMRDFVAEALASAEVLFIDDYSNEDIIRNGVGCDTEPWESKLIDETQVLMQRKKDLYIKSAAMHEVDDVIAGNTVSFDARQNESDKLDRKIAENMRQLSGVFARERARLNRYTVSSMLENLAKAYKSLGQSDDLYIRAATDEVVYQHLLSLSEQMYGATVKDMTLKQLKELDKAYTMVLTTVQNANKVFREGRAQQLSQIVRLVQSQIQSISASEKDPTAAKEKIAKWIRSFSWNELRPVDAFERLGSDSFTELFWDVIDAQGEYGKLVRECADMVTKARKTANYAKWDMKSATTFKTVDGKEFKLTLGDLMSVYAYSKREQAYDHMTEGGFTFDTGRTYKSKENGKTYVHKKLSSTYRISEENLNRIISSLTAEQRKYVDTIQKFLTEFAKHGNKASRTLYGIDLFTEENYFPLFSEQDFRNSTEQDLNNTQTMVSLKESGMTKQTKPGANNPIVLRAFDDVVLEHLDKMAKYATYVLPIENLQRVFNSVGKDGENNTSTKALISSVFGEEATTYFKNYITDLNGGKQATGAANPLADLFARSKATAVSANLSVVIQQPTSIIRAMDEIDLKYFIPLSTKGNAKNNGKLYDEMMKYAPVAVIKDMGGFDVGSSSGLKGYIGTEETAWDAEKAWKAAQDFFGWGAMQMDRIGWTVIWIAVKRETLKKTGLQYGSQAYLEACGKRFTEVVTKTQVYDSVNSRSGFMRSKNDSLKYLTTFMGEPTVTAGMTYMSHLKLYRAVKSKNKTQIAKATREWIRTDAVLVVTALVCGFAKSFVYAMRDDDEDESFMERWFKNFGSAIASDRSFLGLLPVFRDIISIANGYTIERPDLALISDLITASNKVVETISDEEKREKMTPQDWYDLAKNHVGAICNFMGAPAANIIRDVEGAIHFIGDLTDDIYPAEMKESFKRGFSGNEEPKRETLYEAIVADDTGRINVLKKSYVDEDGKFNESAYNSAIRKALREYDPRIREAAQAYFDSDLDRYNEIFDDIFHEDHFEHNDIHAAIMSEVGELEKKNAPEEVVEESEEENRSLYSAESYFNALLAGNKKSANLAYDRLVEAELEEGYLSYEAENNVKSALASQIGSAYKDGKINRETALKLLKENTDKDETDVKKWDFEIKFGYPWSGRDRAYRKGVISESKLIDAIMDIEGESQEAAKAYIKFIELAADHSDLEISADNAADYYEFAHPAKISLEAYMEFKEKTSALTVDKDKNGQTINGSKKKKVMDLINAMSLSVHQKDALYYAAGYKESTIDEAPWH